MTDFTADTSPVQARTARRHRTEFCVYFAIIFLAAIPLATLAWALAAIKQGSVSDKGPLERAWSQARIITPMIFSA